MTLEEYVVTYKAEGDSEPLITIEDYYDRFVHPISDLYKKTSFKKSNTVICCLHDDVNPSLGLVNHKTFSGVKSFHCFGCGMAGTVVRLHQLVEKEHHNRDLTFEQSAIDLLKLYGVPTDTIDPESVKNEPLYIRRLKKINKSMGTYTIQEFHEDLLFARNTDLPIGDRKSIINSAMVKMIATKKKLF